MEHVDTDQLHIGFERYGEPGREPPLILLHGFPDDASAWRGVGPILATAGRHALAPHVRGCGSTRFHSADTPRSGQPAARARDLLALLDALRLDRVVLVGQDWGAATAQALAILHPERVERMVLLNGHGLLNAAVFAQGKRPSWATLHAGWTQWLFQTPLAQALIDADRACFARYLWEQWSPGWRFAEAEFASLALSLGNSDWTAVVLSAYRSFDQDPSADPRDAAASHRLAQDPRITSPTLNLQGARDAVDLFVDTQLGQEAFYTGGFRRVVLDECGHFLQRERPDAVAKQVLAFLAER
ncbi:alpha/beta hydrolase [Aquincola sp. S2]|uniref:Alpha/beta hydrolase n=1 Tax=Pseudaquabacterium terrae TaxID=2732868 RepID=A0ABX2EFD6_9BURK|nr:alpha/beta hydrolase [Aquabacterium terrae]NRF67352.1 alpha/beta hydrolase [Aquabacterium terrae]